LLQHKTEDPLMSCNMDQPRVREMVT
jgi:hypothetical protein